VQPIKIHPCKINTQHEKNNEGKRKKTFQHGCFSVQTFARWTLFTLQLRRGLAFWRRKFQATRAVGLRKLSPLGDDG